MTIGGVVGFCATAQTSMLADKGNGAHTCTRGMTCRASQRQPYLRSLSGTALRQQRQHRRAEVPRICTE